MRITPTYVGNTLRDPVLPDAIKDHPHLRGEYSYIIRAIASQAGSPPPTWGIPVSPTAARIPARITPTYVGNTASDR